MKTLIKNGTIVTAGDTFIADLQIEGERITLLGTDLQAAGARVIDASGLLVMPGGIDAHTHLDMPFGGTTTADDFYTGQRAAAFGGTTTHVDYALQQKGGTLLQAVELWQQKATGNAVIDYGFHVAVTDPGAAVVEEIEQLPDAGISSLKVFQQYKGLFMVDDTTLFQVMQAAKQAGVLVMVHAENGDVTDIVTKQLIAAGKTGVRYHLTAHPREIEAEATGRAIAIAGVTGCRLYVVHMTCEDSVVELALGRSRGYEVMGETCTQYMFKFERDMQVDGYEGAKWACGPPVRTPLDAEYLWRSLTDSTLQFVATDHCSFNYDGGRDGRKPGKELGKEGFHKIPNGIPGIEDRMPVMYHHGVNGGKFDINRFVAITATNPAKALGLYPRKGTIAVGADADIVLWDPDKEHTISAKTHHMNVDYNAYEGMRVRGWPVRTLLRGKSIVVEGRWQQEKGAGQFIHRHSGAFL